MLFNSLTFAVFFLGTVVVLYALPLARRNAWLLGCGFLFYASWSPPYIALLLCTAAIDYVVALKMAALPEQRQRRPWLVGSLVFSLGSLLYFKYTNMFLGTVGTLGRVFGVPWTPPALHIVLPLGISFYTFETISYGIDVYRGQLEPKRSFFEYLSFLMFFPKLIAGPIVRASELLHQIPKPRTFDRAGLTAGLNLIALGFGKKVLFADNFAPFVETVFANPLAHNRWMCLVAAYGYSMQVYLDFSAYSDIARGCARLLGYELPLNFNRPYAAVSMADFWGRWHMTLSRWLRDYLYIPLGGNKGGRLRTYKNLFLTMLLGGLWHGANWTFVVWGALNGIFLLGERVWHDARRSRPRRGDSMPAGERLLRGIVVFHLITLTRIFFRAPTFGVAIDLLHGIVAPRTRVASTEAGLLLIPLATVAYIAASRFRPAIERLEPRGLTLVAYAGLVGALFVFGASQAEFIYFHF
jgi:D-alanyl-lipoteichoic acid acyltransferase DltB (MBOAT superfamily)